MIKNFHQNVQILDKNCSFVHKNVHLVPKNQKICTFYSKNDVFAKIFLQNVQIFDKKCSLVPKNVHLVLKKHKNCTFYTKNKVFAKKFHQNVLWIKTVVLHPKMYIWSCKTKKIVLFTLKIKFLPKKFH